MSTPLYQNSQKLYLPLTQDLHKPESPHRNTAETLTIPPVFLDKQQASSVISRQKRNVQPGAGQTSSLEQVCMEKVCSYEEARKIFQDSYRTVSSGTSLSSP